MVVGDSHFFQNFRHAGHDVALEKLLTVNAIGRTQDRAGPPLDMRQQPLSNRFEIRREISLRHRNTVAGVWPKHLVWLGDGYTSNGHGSRTCQARRSLGGSTVVPGHWFGHFSVCIPVAIRYTVREVSVSTSLAGLSLRRPLNDACRTIPSPVHPAYSISATKSGFSQCTSLPPGGALLPEKGLVDAATAFNSGMMRFTTLALYPVPTVPV